MIQGDIKQFKILNIYTKPEVEYDGKKTPAIDVLQVSQNITLKNGSTKNIYADIKAPLGSHNFKNSLDKSEFLNVNATHMNNNTYYTLLNDKPISKELAEMMIKELSNSSHQEVKKTA